MLKDVIKTDHYYTKKKHRTYVFQYTLKCFYVIHIDFILQSTTGEQLNLEQFMWL